MKSEHESAVLRYYGKRESRWGYKLLLRGVRHYGFYATGFRFGFRRAQRRMEDELIRALDLPPRARVLDAGSGDGVVATRLARSASLDVCGVDLDITSVERARALARASGLPLTFLNESYESLSFGDREFDGVFTMESLVHAGHVTRALHEFGRVLRARGHLALFEYTLAPLSEMRSRERAVWQDIVEGAAMPSLPVFTHDAFPELLHSAGFEDVHVEDITWAVVPMLRQLAWLAAPGYTFLGSSYSRRRFVNITAGATMYEQAVSRDNWRYVKVTARRAASKDDSDIGT
jgi:sterol 24-C-methyltransferase